MPVPTSINDLSTTPASNSPGGGETPKDGDNYIRTLSAFIALLRDMLNGTSPDAVLYAATFAGAHTFQAGGNLLPGTYTPTLTIASGATLTTARVCQYMQMGGTVFVSGSFAASGVTAGTSVEVRISLPVTSSFTFGTEAGGTARNVTDTTGETLGIVALAPGNTVKTFGAANANGAKEYSFMFGYRIV